MQEAWPVDIFASLKVASTEIDAPGDRLQICRRSSGFTCQGGHGNDSQSCLLCPTTRMCSTKREYSHNSSPDATYNSSRWKKRPTTMIAAESSLSHLREGLFADRLDVFYGGVR